MSKLHLRYSACWQPSSLDFNHNDISIMVSPPSWIPSYVQAPSEIFTMLATFSVRFATCAGDVSHSDVLSLPDIICFEASCKLGLHFVATFSINFAISFRPEFQLQEYQLRIPLNLEASSKFLYGLRKLSDLSGIAQWLERQTRDWKVAGSNPCWSGGRIFFSRVDFLCWLISVSVPSTCYRSST